MTDNLDGATVAVHRARRQCLHGPIPPRKTLDRLCRQRRCIRPDHQEMVTHKRNCLRRDKARKAS